MIGRYGVSAQAGPFDRPMIIVALSRPQGDAAARTGHHLRGGGHGSAIAGWSFCALGNGRSLVCRAVVHSSASRAGVFHACAVPVVRVVRSLSLERSRSVCRTLRCT